MAAGIGTVAAIAVGFIGYKVNSAQPHPPPSPPCTGGRTRICIAGFPISPYTADAHWIAREIGKKYPDKYETWYYWSFFEFYPFIKWRFFDCQFPPELKGHDTSPMCWIEEGDRLWTTPIGGDDHFCKWVKAKFPDDPELIKMADAPSLSYLPWKMIHGYYGSDATYTNNVATPTK